MADVISAESVPSAVMDLVSDEVEQQVQVPVRSGGAAPEVGRPPPAARAPGGYRCGVPTEDRDRDEPRLPPGRFADDLVGLDPADPEAQAFAAHLDRLERQRSSFTVEGYLADVGDFADSANRAAGLRRTVAVVVVGLILVGVLVAVWNALGFMFTTFL